MGDTTTAIVITVFGTAVAAYGVLMAQSKARLFGVHDNYIGVWLVSLCITA